MGIGGLAYVLESMFGDVWSAGELALAFSRVGDMRADPYRAALVEDIERRGFHVPLDPAELAIVIDADGRIHGTNPYRRIAPHVPERILGKLVARGRRPSRHLVVMCHCYGVPSPRVMSLLFGLGGLDADVVYNIMGNHQPGTYPLWPGSGFTCARVSRFVENVRASVTAARALTQALVRTRGYERVTAIGFSIGGQLALHLATAEALDRAVLYCPVASLRVTASQLGLMRVLAGPVRRAIVAMGNADPLEVLGLTEPLRYPMRTRERDVHVIVQEFDALAPPHQIEAIRTKYPGVRWHSMRGTHIYPSSVRTLRRLVRDAVDAV